MAKKKTSKRRRAPPVEKGAKNDLPAPAKNKGGRPTRYKPEYCEMLVKHLREGYSVESFGAVAGVTREVIWRWAQRFPEFAEAKARGEMARELHYIRMGQAIATGQLKMLVKEEYVQDADGNVVRDENRQPYINRIYRSANTNSAAWIFLTKNMLGWRDKRDVQLSGTLETSDSISREERIEEIEKLHMQRKALQGPWRE